MPSIYYYLFKAHWCFSPSELWTAILMIMLLGITIGILVGKK